MGRRIGVEFLSFLGSTFRVIVFFLWNKIVGFLQEKSTQQPIKIAQSAITLKIYGFPNGKILWGSKIGFFLK
jgi:hypothetical protein